MDERRKTKDQFVLRPWSFVCKEEFMVRQLLALALLVTLLAGCGPASPPPYEINVTAEQIAQAQRTWQEKKLGEYRIKVVAGQPALSGQVGIVLVYGGKVAQAYARPLPANWLPIQAMRFGLQDMQLVTDQRQATQFTVPGLFKAIQDASAHAASTARRCKEGKVSLNVEFDPQWSYPSSIVYSWDASCDANSPMLWQVLEFQPLNLGEGK
jgi:hypothetical protein